MNIKNKEKNDDENDSLDETDDNTIVVDAE